MNSHMHRNCAVQGCNNSSLKSPNLRFIAVPFDEYVRMKWIEQAGLPASYVTKKRLFFCEEHFDMPNDMENYVRYKMMGKERIIMKPGCIPTRFECQGDESRLPSQSNQQSNIQLQPLSTEQANMQMQTWSTEQANIQLQTSNNEQENMQLQTSNNEQANMQLQTSNNEQANMQLPPWNNEQANMQLPPWNAEQPNIQQPTPGIKIEIDIEDYETSIANSAVSTDYSNDFTLEELPKFDQCTPKTLMDKGIQVRPKFRSKFVQAYVGKVTVDRAISPIFDITCAHLRPSLSSRQRTQCYSDISMSDELEHTLFKIMKRPRFYIGISKQYIYIIDYLERETKLPRYHILLCLKRIRLHNAFIQLGDDFGVSPTLAKKIFLEGVPVLASVLRPLLVDLIANVENYKRKILVAVEQKEFVGAIIDCLEIEVQKPSKTVSDVITRSNYKNKDTVKYLISSTPNGLINYISPCFGGKISNIYLVKSCNFLYCLPNNVLVLAGRGLRNINRYLRELEICVVRPSSNVENESKSIKIQSFDSNEIISLDVHVERAVKRIREYRMLNPHACLPVNSLNILDDVVTIVCGLINLQDPTANE